MKDDFRSKIMQMSPSRYKAECETYYRTPKEHSRERYVSALLLEELGENASLFAKAMRDSHEVSRESLKKELGDVCWSIHVLSENVPDDWEVLVLGGNASVVSFAQLVFSELVIREDQDRFFFTAPLFVCQSFYLLCKNLGFDPEEIAAENLKKLKDRKERNVLHGSGDDR